MSSIKSRFSHARSKLLRRRSGASSVASSAGSDRAPKTASSLRKSISLSKLPEVSADHIDDEDEDDDAVNQRLSKSEVIGTATGRRSEATEVSSTSRDRQNTKASTAPNSPTADVRTAHHALILEAPTPLRPQPPALAPHALDKDAAAAEPSDSEELSELPSRPSTKATPPDILRRQSLVAPSNARAIKTLLEPDSSAAAVTGPLTATDYFAASSNFNAGMLHRKIWVKRPGASPTLVQIREDDLVDDVREMILRKYGNSLGKSFDAPDLTLRILPRDSNAKSQDRILGPEEEMCRTLDAYYPGGQVVSEALVIEVPKPRTPKPSPRVPVFYAHHDDSQNHQTEYFPPMPLINPSPAAMSAGSHEPRVALTHAPHSITVLQTGQLPPLPSPGSSRRIHANRPRNARHNTASPTTLPSVPPSAATTRPTNRPRHDSSASETKHSVSSNAPIPTPPAPADTSVRQVSTPPTPRVASPRPDKKRRRAKAIEPPTLPAGLLDGSVPPINVLIVEDNIINLRVLGAFMQRLKVRWQKAMNGKEAIEKWRAGGFHLVLMDIQLPIMDGLEATREIRRLERVNGIGVFSSGSNEAPNNRLGQDGGYGKEVPEDDKLGDKSLFKSPIIIVALTASSLQSDRHEALAAGCNDFLTKPVNFVWLERKVKEWGCMQALIDFDGWRKWKDFAADSDTTTSTSKLSTSYSSIAPRKGKVSISPTSNPTNGIAGPSSANGAPTKPKDEEKKSKRKSMGLIPPPSVPEEDIQNSAPDDDRPGES